jgi:hypothetical protein
MAEASSLGVFLDSIRARLMERSGLAGVRVFTGPVGDKDIGRENIVFGVDPIEVDQAYPTVPQREAFETFSVEGRIWIVKPGGGEAVIKAARDRAMAVLSEVQSECVTNHTMDGAVRDVLLTSYKLEQFPLDAARDCRIAFNLDVKSEFTAP